LSLPWLTTSFHDDDEVVAALRSHYLRDTTDGWDAAAAAATAAIGIKVAVQEKMDVNASAKGFFHIIDNLPLAAFNRLAIPHTEAEGTEGADEDQCWEPMLYKMSTATLKIIRTISEVTRLSAVFGQEWWVQHCGGVDWASVSSPVRLTYRPRWRRLTIRFDFACFKSRAAALEASTPAMLQPRKHSAVQKQLVSEQHERESNLDINKYVLAASNN
jgi:hypothetical protein